MRAIMLIYLFFVGIATTHPQAVPRLKIGDTIPDIKFEMIRNYPVASLRLKDVKKKLIVIDIWSHWCSSCISAFPKMEALQKKFNDDIQVLLVTADNENEFRRVYNRSEILKSTSLPMVINYKKIKEMFPYSSLPMHVWIDSLGVIKQITSGFNTNEQNINRYLEHKNISADRRDNEITNLDLNSPLMQDKRLWEEIRSYSCFMEGMINYKSSVVTLSIKDGKNRGFRLINLSLSDIVRLAMNVTDVSLEFEGAESYLFPYEDETKIDSFERNYLFCYESMLPENKSSQKEIQQKLITDICEYFDVNMSIEKRMMECYYVTSKGPLNIKSKTDKASLVNEKLNDKWIFKAVNFEVFLSTIPRMLGKQPSTSMVNKTGYGDEEMVDAEVRFDGSDLTVLNEELAKYNLYVEKGMIEKNVAVVRKNSESSVQTKISEK